MANNLRAVVAIEGKVDSPDEGKIHCTGDPSFSNVRKLLRGLEAPPILLALTNWNKTGKLFNQ